MTDISRSDTIPAELAPEIKRAGRLEWWTLFWMGSVVVVMGLVMGSSQAMRAAWIEDLLSLLPAIVFLIAARFERRPPDQKFPFGYRRVNSLAFLISAVALAGFGGFLLFDSAIKLIGREHPTIGLATVFGHDIWYGWLMIAALAYSAVPPVILGRRKLPVARRLQDKVLHTDALMQKADWMTALSGIAGIVGVGYGLWWADAVAAGFISFEILRDGVKNLRIATAELVDGAPRRLDNNDIAEDALALERVLRARFPGADIRMRESGRYVMAQVRDAAPPENDLVDELCPPDRPWRLGELSFVPPSRPKV